MAMYQKLMLLCINVLWFCKNAQFLGFAVIYHELQSYNKNQLATSFTYLLLSTDTNRCNDSHEYDSCIFLRVTLEVSLRVIIIFHG